MRSPARRRKLVAAISEHERLRHQLSGQLRLRAADTEHVGRKLLVVGGVAHLGEAGEQFVSQHLRDDLVPSSPSQFRSRPWPALNCGESVIGSRPPMATSPAIARTAARSA